MENDNKTQNNTCTECDKPISSDQVRCTACEEDVAEHGSAGGHYVHLNFG
jgi:hypothetical protein